MNLYLSLAAIILAGGKATRLGHHRKDTPKGLIKFNNHSFLTYLVSWLHRSGCNPIVLSISSVRSHMMETIFNTPFWRKLGVVLVKEDKPLGTGGGSRLAAQTISATYVFLCNGDTVVDIHLRSVLDSHIANRFPCSAVLTRRCDVPNAGAVEVDPNGRIIGFSEGRKYGPPGAKEDGGYRASSTGCYVFDGDMLLKAIPARKPCSLELEVLPSLVKAGLVRAYDNGEQFMYDYGTPKGLEWLRNNPHLIAQVYGIPYG